MIGEMSLHKEPVLSDVNTIATTPGSFVRAIANSSDEGWTPIAYAMGFFNMPFELMLAFETASRTVFGGVKTLFEVMNLKKMFIARVLFVAYRAAFSSFSLRNEPHRWTKVCTLVAMHLSHVS